MPSPHDSPEHRRAAPTPLHRRLVQLVSEAGRLDEAQREAAEIAVAYLVARELGRIATTLEEIARQRRGRECG